MAALDHPGNDIVAPETDGPLELQEDLCRCEHRRPLPAGRGEDSRPQPPPDTVQPIVEGMPLEGGEISRPRAAACVPDIHDRHHRSVTDQDIPWAEIGMDHVRCLSWWRDGGTDEPQALDQGRHHGGIPREPGDSRFLTGGDPPGVRPVVVGFGGLASLEFDDLHQLLNDGRGSALAREPRQRSPSDAIHKWLWPPLRARPGWDSRACACARPLSGLATSRPGGRGTPGALL